MVLASVFVFGCASDLRRSAAEGDRPRADELISAGEDINAPDDYGWTPLHYAVSRRQGEMVILLLERGAAIAPRDRIGRSPLDLSAQYNFPDMAELLISRGADPLAVDPCGGAPLHYAANKGNTAVIEVLLSHGADLNARDKQNGWTPLDFAVNNGKTDAANLLRARGGTGSSYSAALFLQARAPRGTPAPVDRPLAAGVPTVTYDSFSGQTELLSFFSVESLLLPSQIELFQESLAQHPQTPEDFYRSSREAWLIGPFREIRLDSGPEISSAARLTMAVESEAFFFFDKVPLQAKVAGVIQDAPFESAASSVGEGTVRTQAVFLIGPELAAALSGAEEASLRIAFSDRPPLTWAVPARVLASWREHFRRAEELFGAAGK
jgi:hypothetical protein